MHGSRPTAALLVLAATTLLGCPLRAQDARQLIRSAVHSELRASHSDLSLWSYRDEDDSPGHRATYNAIETTQGELRRLIALNGQPLAPAAQQREFRRIRTFVNSPTAQARARRNGQHDDAQATRFLTMLPDAFTWTVVRQTPSETTLHYQPNPSFSPPSMEARVLAAMAGDVIIARNGDRIQSLRGRLTHDVLFGFGLFGRMNAGGTFNVQRRQVAPGHWEITQNDVHIGGHVLLFKSINQNADELKTDWHPSTARTLAEAARDLGVP